MIRQKSLPSWLVYLSDQKPKHKQNYEKGTAYHNYLRPRGRGWRGKKDPLYGPRPPSIIPGPWSHAPRRGVVGPTNLDPRGEQEHGPASIHSARGEDQLFENNFGGPPPPPPPWAGGQGRPNSQQSQGPGADLVRGGEPVYGMGEGEVRVQFSGVGDTMRSGSSRGGANRHGRGRRDTLMDQPHQPAAVDLGELRGPPTSSSHSGSRHSRGRPLGGSAVPGGGNLPRQFSRDSREGPFGGGVAPPGELRPPSRTFDPAGVRGQATGPPRYASRSSMDSLSRGREPPGGMRHPPAAFDRTMHGSRSASRSSRDSMSGGGGPPGGIRPPPRAFDPRMLRGGRSMNHSRSTGHTSLDSRYGPPIRMEGMPSVQDFGHGGMGPPDLHSSASSGSGSHGGRHGRRRRGRGNGGFANSYDDPNGLPLRD